MSAEPQEATVYTSRRCRLCGRRFVVPAGVRAFYCAACQPPLPGLEAA